MEPFETADDLGAEDAAVIPTGPFIATIVNANTNSMVTRKCVNCDTKVVLRSRHSKSYYCEKCGKNVNAKCTYRLQFTIARGYSLIPVMAFECIEPLIGVNAAEFDKLCQVLPYLPDTCELRLLGLTVKIKLKPPSSNSSTNPTALKKDPIVESMMPLGSKTFIQIIPETLRQRVVVKNSSSTTSASSSRGQKRNGDKEVTTTFVLPPELALITQPPVEETEQQDNQQVNIPKTKSPIPIESEPEIEKQQPIVIPSRPVSQQSSVDMNEVSGSSRVSADNSGGLVVKKKKKKNKQPQPQAQSDGGSSSSTVVQQKPQQHPQQKQKHPQQNKLPTAYHPAGQQGKNSNNTNNNQKRKQSSNPQDQQSHPFKKPKLKKK